MSPRILVIDNYDSFVYNLVQYLGELGAQPIVFRDSDLAVNQIDELGVDGVLISPGPGHPRDAQLSNDVIQQFAGRLPILGVCLGLQCIGHVYGATIAQAPEIVHGKTATITHDGTGLFTGIDSPVEVTRYHSLIVDGASMPEELRITAQTSDGIVMGLRHRDVDVEGVQFHPESVLTQHGHAMVQNFIDRCSSHSVSA